MNWKFWRRWTTQAIKVRNYRGEEITMRDSDKLTLQCPIEMHGARGQLVHQMNFVMEFENRSGVLVVCGPLRFASEEK